MILIKEQLDTTATIYHSKYYKTRKAQKENKHSWFRYITSIIRYHNGMIEINGTIGRRKYLLCSLSTAITDYNRNTKEQIQS